MTDAFGVEQKCIEEIQVGWRSIPVGLASVKEERNFRINGVQFVGKFGERFPFVFLTDQVETSHEIRI